MGKIIQFIKYLTLAATIVTLILTSNTITHEPDQLRSWILSFGLFSPVLYVLLCSIRPLILFPFLILTIAGGLAFGATLGTILTIVGGLFGASLSFYITRNYGDFLKIEKKRRLIIVEKKIEEKGFQYVLILRIVPFLNFELVSYSSGLSNVRYKPYFFATLIGMVPGTIGLNYLGSSLATRDITHIVVMLVILIIIVMVSVLIIRTFSN